MKFFISNKRMKSLRSVLRSNDVGIVKKRHITQISGGQAVAEGTNTNTGGCIGRASNKMNNKSTVTTSSKKVVELDKKPQVKSSGRNNGAVKQSQDITGRDSTGNTPKGSAAIDIDSLFANFRDAKKKKIEDQRVASKVELEDEKKRIASLKKARIAALRITNPEAPIHRMDHSSGLPVYKAHLLKVGDGGGTPLCPFDCNCCF